MSEALPNQHVTSSENIPKCSPAALHSCGLRTCEDRNTDNAGTVDDDCGCGTTTERSPGLLYPQPPGVDLKFISCDTCGNALAGALDLSGRAPRLSLHFLLTRPADPAAGPALSKTAAVMNLVNSHQAPFPARLLSQRVFALLAPLTSAFRWAQSPAIYH